MESLNSESEVKLENTHVKISIIVPAYNVQCYLKRNLDSILAQTFTDFELLLINDGSTDDTALICDEYAKKDSRVIVFHKKNGGVSSARNLGLEKAKGEWIAFIDSDDAIKPDYLENFYKYISEDVDNIIGGFKCIYNKSTSQTLIIEQEKLSTKLAFEKRRLDRLGFVWGRIFRSSTIKENALKFDEKISYAEDLIFIYDFFLHTNKIQFIDYVGYDYYSNGNSLSKVYNSFDSEYSLFAKLKKHLKYFLNEDICKSHIFSKFKRTIDAMYRPKHLLKKEQRLENLKMIYAEQVDILDMIPANSIYSKYKNNLSRLDTCLRFFFLIRYNFFVAKIWNIYLNYKHIKSIKNKPTISF